MKFLILKMSKNYPEIIVTQSSNSFGDQILTLVVETIEGVKEARKEMFLEGNWIPFTKKEMKKLFNV